MSIRWIFLVLIFAYGISVLAAVEDFNQIIADSSKEQIRLAIAVQDQLQDTKQKTLENSGSESIALQGSILKIVN